MSKPTDGAVPWPAGDDLDQAMESAFHEAVRRHRAANEPMVMWEEGEVRHVSPFEIPLPGEDLPRAPNTRVASPEEWKRRPSGAN
jgi:hypothetical protein